VLAAMMIAHAMAHGALVHPGCGWKGLTGIPCPGCGGTRSLAALGEGDWWAALNLNPFVALGAVATWVAVPLTWLDVATNRARGTAFVRRCVRTRGFHGGAIALLILNWLWLCLGGR
jgi:hypothetical protein